MAFVDTARDYLHPSLGEGVIRTLMHDLGLPGPTAVKTLEATAEYHSIYILSFTRADAVAAAFATAPASTDVEWADADSFGNWSNNVGNVQYTDVHGWFGIRQPGTVGVQREEPWKYEVGVPTEPTTLETKILVTVKLGTSDIGWKFRDGSLIEEDSDCPTTVDNFGELPSVQQQRALIWDNYVEGKFLAFDCYLMGEASIVGGAYEGKGCDVTASRDNADRYATCLIERDDGSVQDDWLTGPGLDFLSETTKFTVLQDYARPWISSNIDDYAAGMLTVGYHTA